MNESNSHLFRKTRIVLCSVGLLVLSPSALPVGAQFGFEFAIDAPWRIEPIPNGGQYKYGPIPITIVFHDAIFEYSRPSYARELLPSIQIGTLTHIEVAESDDSYSSQMKNVKKRHVRAQDVAEIERKRWVSTTEQEPLHEICRPGVGEDCAALRYISDSHEWHAMFWYHPQHPVAPGRNIRLAVTVHTVQEGRKRQWTNTLVVHAGEEPLPRFSNEWLYGDVHYHSQMTDNDGESGYAYRNVVRTMGSMGIDFIFATDHASDHEQTLGSVDFGANGDWREKMAPTVTVSRCGSPQGKACSRHKKNSCGSQVCKTFTAAEARDLNSVRFAAAKRILYGNNGANEAVAQDLKTGGIANYESRRILPQLFLGEEIDVWPEMSKSEHERGYIDYGDGLAYIWSNADSCLSGPSIPDFIPLTVEQLNELNRLKLENCKKQFSTICSNDDTALECYRTVAPIGDVNTQRPTRRDHTQRDSTRPSRRDHTSTDSLYLVLDKQGALFDLPARQHIVYFPNSTALDSSGWVSSSTGPFGGSTKTAKQVFEEVQRGGFAFLAHPVENKSPGGFGPDMVPWSRKALDKAWSSPAILGLQFWNEDDHKETKDLSHSITGKTVMKVNTYKRDNTTTFDYAMRPGPWDSRKKIPGTMPPKWKPIRDKFRDRMYHGGFTWDTYLRKGLNPALTKNLSWLPDGEPRRWFMAGGSDGHGDFNYRRYGRPEKGLMLLGGDTHPYELDELRDNYRWSDFPIGDSGIARPRNIVNVGHPTQRTPGLSGFNRHRNTQVIEALRRGQFSVTDGPIVRIAIDKNLNGRIDHNDYEMGSVFELFPGEHVPLLVEWISTPEFGTVKTLDVYVGNPNRTFAPDKHGPYTDSQNRRSVAYAIDPADVLRINVNKDHDDKGYRGIAKLFLSPKQFELNKIHDGLFYARAYIETDQRNCTKEAGGRSVFTGNDCGFRLGYSNPVWGRYRIDCSNGSTIAIDRNNNSAPDICEADRPNPCPIDKFTGGDLQTSTLSVSSGAGRMVSRKPPQGARVMQESGPAAAVKKSPNNSCHFVDAWKAPLTVVSNPQGGVNLGAGSAADSGSGSETAPAPSDAEPEPAPPPPVRMVNPNKVFKLRKPAQKPRPRE